MTTPATTASLSPDFETLAREVDMVAVYINDLRAAINGLGILDITDSKLSAAQNDLNDVIMSTRTATDAILETAETLLDTKMTGTDYRRIVEDRMIALMEACSFQDLTGQRLTRVSNTLRAMDERLKLFSLAVRPKGGEITMGDSERRRMDWQHKNLVNGPGGADAVRQDQVDLMLNAG